MEANKETPPVPETKRTLGQVFKHWFIQPDFDLPLPPDKTDEEEKEWKTLGKKIQVEESISSINSSAEKLKSLVLWFWTLYTAILSLDLKFAQADLDFWAVLLIPPCVFLIFAYLYVTYTESYVKTSFDRTNADDVEQAIQTSIRTKHWRYQRAIAFTIISAIWISVAYPSFYIRKNKLPLEIKKETKVEFLSIGSSSSNNQKSMSVLLSLKENSKFRLSAYIKSEDKNPIMTRFFFQEIQTTTDTKYPVLFSIPETKDKILLEISWEEEKTNRSIWKVLE